MQICGFDKTFAPEGKSVIKVELISSCAYWKQLYADKEKYNAGKRKGADRVRKLDWLLSNSDTSLIC
jgi:hypothetical protein